MSISPDFRHKFTQAVLSWFERYGRKGLPWQQNSDAYSVWVSEIMLQQTQVDTVIPYYRRFMQAFPNVKALAEALEDEVLFYWSGLGYYARARNLHRAAKLIVQKHGGCFPQDFEAVVALPGIGRSTAGAILSLAFGQRHALLDGNVKRVLARVFRVQGWPGQAKVGKALWALAEALLPPSHVAQYNQAMMDLGAMVCRRKNPLCLRCPLHDVCLAFQHDDVASYPAPRPRKRLPLRRRHALVIRDEHDRLLLERRPSTGVWGGLWSFPELEPAPLPGALFEYLGLPVAVEVALVVQQHLFSHYRLELQLWQCALKSPMTKVLDAQAWLWYNPRQRQICGLAAPVERYLKMRSEK